MLKVLFSWGKVQPPLGKWDKVPAIVSTRLWAEGLKASPLRFRLVLQARAKLYLKAGCPLDRAILAASRDLEAALPPIS